MTETTDFGEYRNEDKPDTNLKIYTYEKTIKKEESIHYYVG